LMILVEFDLETGKEMFKVTLDTLNYEDKAFDLIVNS